MPKSLHNLRDEEEGQLDRMLLEDAMRILKKYGIIVIPSLKEGGRKDWRNRLPEQDVLQHSYHHSAIVGTRY